LESNTSSFDSILKILVGNKCDLKDLRVINYEKGVSFGAKYDMPFYEVSAKTDININELFNDIAQKLVEQNMKNDNLKLSLSDNNNNLNIGQEKKLPIRKCC
jgi:GTPase SAR1 family protein